LVVWITLDELVQAGELVADDPGHRGVRGLAALARQVDAFEEIILKEVENLNRRFVDGSRRYDRLTAGPWPMSEIYSLDLFRIVQKHLVSGLTSGAVKG
jgi:hypothetical protein